MLGTIINVVAIIIGGLVGMTFGKRLPSRVHQTVLAGMGLFTASIGIQMFLKTENVMVVLGSLLIGSLLGEWWRIEDGLRAFGAWLEVRVSKPEADGSKTESRFIRGFLTASLLVCIGPIAILGSIQDGLSGDFSLLAIKSVLDLFAALAFASTLGLGVIFSAIPLFIYQGGISLLAVQAQSLISDPMMNEMTATGGILLIAIAISGLLEMKPIRVGNMLPAIIIAPAIVAVLKLLNIG